jgi:hypothetical protein
MFTVDIRKNGKWKDVTIHNFLFGDLSLGLLTDIEVTELANDFREAADQLDGGNDE